MKIIITLVASSIPSCGMNAFAADQPAPAATAQTQTVPSDPAAKKPDSGPVKEVGFGAVRTPKLVNRVGGDRDAAIEVVEGVYRFKKAMIESPLPDGYPEPTPFGAIDIKEYPAVRRAELISKDESGAAMMTGFFPLFNHIKKRDIAMTAPVEMDYPGLYKDFMKDEPSEKGSTTMSFLYRSSKQGPVGEDGKIVVRDAAPVKVLSIGAKGAFDPAMEFDALRTWLRGQEEWEVAGDPRMFVYNGPFIDMEWRWSEVQVPIRRRGEAAKPGADAASGAAPAAAQSGDASKLEFDGGSNGWQTFLDGVMGGRSTGRISAGDGGTLLFTGELSLENNGGFSQIRTAVPEGTFAGSTGLVLRVKGDGRSYKFDIRSSRLRVMAGAYQSLFQTKAGEWTEVKIPFDRCVATIFAQPVSDAPALDPASIESVGITLADKQEGPFAIEIDWIRPIGVESAPPAKTDGR